MKFIKQFAKIFILIILLSPLLGCVEKPSAPPQQVTIRMGYLTRDLHHVAYFVAKNTTIFNGTSIYQKYGIEIKDAIPGGAANGGVLMDRFYDGDVDIGYLGSPPAILKHLNAGTNTTIIAQVNDIGSALVVEPSINKTEELKGKKLATPGHTTIQYFILRTYLEKYGIYEGIGRENVTIEDVPVGVIKDKLQSGDVAGFVAWEPFPSDAAVSGTGKVLLTSNEMWPDHLDCVMAVDNNFYRNNREVVVRFLKAHIEATEWIDRAIANPDSLQYKQLIEISMEFTGKNESVVKMALNNIRFKYDIDQKFLSSFEQYTNKLLENNMVSRSKLDERGYSNVADFIDKYIDKSPLAEAKG